MPKFSMMPVHEATREAEISSMPDDLVRYADYLYRLTPGEAGKLIPSPGEDVRTLRLRLSAAARRMQKKFVIRRSGDELVFWENTQT